MAEWLSLHTLLQRPGVFWFGSWAQTYTPLIKPCCGCIPHRRTRRTYNWDIQLCAGALGREKKEEDWQQRLTQGQSSREMKKKNRIRKTRPFFAKGEASGFPVACVHSQRETKGLLRTEHHDLKSPRPSFSSAR